MIPAFAERGYAATTIAAIPAVIEGHLHAGHAAAVPAPAAVLFSGTRPRQVPPRVVGGVSAVVEDGGDQLRAHVLGVQGDAVMQCLLARRAPAPVRAVETGPGDAHRTSGGGHVGSWNVDKAGYERVLRDFVTRLIA